MYAGEGTISKFSTKTRDRVKSIVLLTFSANLKDKLNNRSVGEGGSVQVPANLQSDGAKIVYEGDLNNRMSPNTHVYRGSYPDVINALIRRFRT